MRKLCPDFIWLLVLNDINLIDFEWLLQHKMALISMRLLLTRITADMIGKP